MTPRARRSITKQAPWQRKVTPAPRIITKTHITCSGCFYYDTGRISSECNGCFDKMGMRTKYAIRVICK